QDGGRARDRHHARADGHGRRHHAKTRVRDQRGASFRDQRHLGAGLQPRRDLGRAGRLVRVEAGDDRLVGDPDVGQQAARAARVFRHDQLGRPQGVRGPRRQVARVAQRRRHDEQRALGFHGFPPGRAGAPRRPENTAISACSAATGWLSLREYMDLIDGPSDPTSPSSSSSPTPSIPPESRMRRFSKVLAFSAACSAALILTVRHGGDGIRVGADSQLRAATRTTAGKYDLSQLPIFTKTLFYVRENYFDKNRLDPRRMLVGALDFVQRDVPEILIDRWPEHDPKQVTVKVNGQQRSSSIERVDAPWSLRSTLQDIFRFVQPNLQPVPEKEEARRLVEIEMAATNGMLYTLDPHSVLLDVETYKDMRTQTQGKFGGLGIVIEMDKKGRITVKRPMPDTPAMRVGMRAKDHIVRINNEST